MFALLRSTSLYSFQGDRLKKVVGPIYGLKSPRSFLVLHLLLFYYTVLEQQIESERFVSMNYTMAYITVLQLFVFCFGSVDVLAVSTSSEQEIHTFRWTTTPDWTNTSCAIGLDLKKLYNYTVMDDELENYISKNTISVVCFERKLCCNL